ncbi:MAG: glutathione S-transferase [Proteobacteria bacterium]|nr:glutathione S-transferase [Pseudomonadota bacterium]
MLKILGRKTSSNVQNVLWCCGELKLRFEREDIGGPFGRNDTPEYLALNPNGLVPTIVDDGYVQWESCSIVRYLSAKHGAGSLWPTDPARRGEADRWMDWHLSTVAPLMRPIFINLVRTPPEKRDMAAVAKATRELGDKLRILDAHLKARRFVAGDSLSMGDIPLGIIAYRWFGMALERPDLPSLRAWYDRLSGRPAYREHVMIPIT